MAFSMAFSSNVRPVSFATVLSGNEVKSRMLNSAPSSLRNSPSLWGLWVANSKSIFFSCFPAFLRDIQMSSERRKPYPFDQIEPKWQAIWDERRSFHVPNPDEKNF